MIAVVGAGGPTGLECVRLLTEEGKSVRAVVRSPQKYEGKFGSAQVVQGDVTDLDSLKQAFSGCKGVIFAASASSYRGSGGPFEVDYRGVDNTAAAAAAVGVELLVMVSSRFVDPVNRFNPIRMILNNIKYSLMDYKFEGEQILRNRVHNIDYTIVRPGGLVGGEGSMARKTDVEPGTQYIIACEAEGDCSGGGSIHRRDVAAVVCEAFSSSDAKNKTVEIVARPLAEGDPSFGEHLKEIYKSLS